MISRPLFVLSSLVKMLVSECGDAVFLEGCFICNII